MAEGITARLNQIKNGVALLTTEAKQAANQTAQLNTKLKFDPTNVNLVVQRFEALQNELDTNNKKLEGLTKAQEKLKAAKADITGTDEESLKLLSDIEKTAAQYERDIAKAQANQARLNQLLSQTNKNQAIINTVTAQINQKYDIWIRASEKLANATKKIYNTLKNVVSEASETGLQLYSLAKRYNTTAEDIQTWDRALQLATGQSELFTQSLSVMVKGMSQVASGRGVAFRKALKGIGVSYKEIADLSTSQQFEAIIEGLAGIENESMRAAYAQQLLGESGQYIASVLADGGEALEGYKNKAAAFGIVANSDAEALAEMNIRIEQAKSKFAEAKAQLAVALLPALDILTDLISNYLAPAIKWVADRFKNLSKAGQGFILIIGGILLILPKMIKTLAMARIAFLSVQNGAKGATIAITGLKTAMVGLSAVAGVLGIVFTAITLISQLGKKAEETTDAMREMADVGESMGLMGADAQVNTESTATSMRTMTAEISVEIHGYGDTSISDDAAVTVAQLTADQVNRSLGELTKG